MGKEPRIDPDLLAQVEAAGVAVEAVIDDALRAALRRSDAAAGDLRAAQWAEENAGAIDDYNRRIASRGLVGAEFRKW